MSQSVYLDIYFLCVDFIDCPPKTVPGMEELLRQSRLRVDQEMTASTKGQISSYNARRVEGRSQRIYSLYFQSIVRCRSAAEELDRLSGDIEKF